MATNKLSTFQLGLTAFFVVCILGGVAVFTLYGGQNRGETVGEVVIWGTMKQSTFDSVLINLTGTDKSFQKVSYIEKNPATYHADVTEAIASGRSPDLFLLDDDQIVSFGNKIIPVPYSEVSQQTFNNTFIDESSIYLSPNGILGLPITIDPLVMYYNRDLFSSAGVAVFPRTWTELQTIAPKMTALDASSNVKRSAVAMGSFSNINHAKEILSALFMQVGETMVGVDASGNLTSTFGSAPSNGVETPAQSALRFYSNFSNPTQTIYSWNKALPNSMDSFVSGDLGIYFGRASEFSVIQKRNPNLAFSVATIPQTAGAKVRITYGRMTALAIPRGALNVYGATVIIQKLVASAPIAEIATATELPPTRRDLISDVPQNSTASVFADSALISRTWADPDPKATNVIFKDMVESTVSGREQLDGAIRTAATELSNLFSQLNGQ